MFAVIKTGGKQYRVVPDDVLEVGKIEGEVGSIIQLNEVLVLGGDTPVLGVPTVAGASRRAGRCRRSLRYLRPCCPCPLEIGGTTAMEPIGFMGGCRRPCRGQNPPNPCFLAGFRACLP